MYESEIGKAGDLLRKFRRSLDGFKQERDVLELVEMRYRLMYDEIHNFLALRHTAEAEKQIREYIKEISLLDLLVCEAKIEWFNGALVKYERAKDTVNADLCYKYLARWLNLYEGLYALVAFRSLEHWALFSEWDKNAEDKFWKYSIDTFGDGGYSGCTKGFFYYANQICSQRKAE